MSASTHQSPVHGREGGTAKAHGGRAKLGLPPKTRMAGLLLTALVASCSSNGSIATGTVPTPTVTSPAPTPTAVDEQQAILEPYRKFWAALTPVSRMPAAERRDALTPFTVDPELKSLLAGMTRTDAKKQVFYGAHMPRATVASIAPDGRRAVIDDCQDSTHTGLARLPDLAPVTKGVARNHVVVTMSNTGTAWKVYFVSYTKTPC